MKGLARCRHSQSIVSPTERLVPDAEISAVSPKSYLLTSPEKYAQFQRKTTKRCGTGKTEQCDPQGKDQQQRWRTSISQTVLDVQRRTYLSRWFAVQGRKGHIAPNSSVRDAGEDSWDSPGNHEVQKLGRTSLILARDVITDTRACCSLQGVCRTLQSKAKGTNDPSWGSRSTLGEGRRRSFWAQQPSLPGHGWLLLKVAKNIKAGQSDNQECHLLHEESDLEVWNSRWGDNGQLTSVCLSWIYSVHERLWHQTHNIQSLPPTSKWTSRRKKKHTKKLYRLLNACWWKRKTHTKRCLTTQTVLLTPNALMLNYF